jgi:predicted enzyme related to lactoylglutathione lyase
MSAQTAKQSTCSAIRPVHFEFMTADPDKTAAFFAKAFGWATEKWDGPMEYHMVRTGEGPGIDGGIGRSPDGKPFTCNVVAVENLDATLRKVTAAGGQVVMPKFAIPTVGWLAYAAEPTGIVFGMMQGDPGAA